jgi:hypothetical protein
MYPPPHMTHVSSSSIGIMSSTRSSQTSACHMYPPPHMTHVSSSSYDTCILLLHRYYVKYSKQSNFRLSHEDISLFNTEVFGVIPDNLDDIMLKVGTPSRSAQNGGLCIDIIRFMKLLYFITCPEGVKRDLISCQKRPNVVSKET